MSVAPREDANVTSLPLTGLPLPSRSVTVIVEVATPSDVTVAGPAVTVDVVADTAPAVNVTDEDLAYRTFRALEMQRAVFYVQEFVPHGRSDLRFFVVGQDNVDVLPKLRAQVELLDLTNALDTLER